MWGGFVCAVHSSDLLLLLLVILLVPVVLLTHVGSARRVAESAYSNLHDLCGEGVSARPSFDNQLSARTNTNQ